MMRWLGCVFFSVFFSAFAASGQVVDNSVQRVDVSTRATILDNINLTTIRDVNLNGPKIIDGKILVSPISSPYAGLMRIEGRPGRTVRITYLRNETLEEQNGSGGLVRAIYQISGFDSDNQAASVLLDIGEATVRIGANGYYYIWLGANLDVSQAKPGAYLSEFILELEGN